MVNRRLSIGIGNLYVHSVSEGKIRHQLGMCKQEFGKHCGIYSVYTVLNAANF